MKTKRTWSIALLAISTAIFSTACFNRKNNDKDVAVSNNTVSMNNSAFNPASLTVAVGSSITWMNDDNVIHAVTTSDGSLNTGDIAPTTSYTVTFNTVRTYNYYDAHNPNMTGQLIVTGSPASGLTMLSKE